MLDCALVCACMSACVNEIQASPSFLIATLLFFVVYTSLIGSSFSLSLSFCAFLNDNKTNSVPQWEMSIVMQPLHTHMGSPTLHYSNVFPLLLLKH